MINYILDISRTKLLQISNDAFCYLMYGEDPLDENNEDEIEEILAMFPYGYSINNWEYVDGETDLIEVSFIPYVLSTTKYDGYMEFIAKNWVFKYKIVDKDIAQINISNEESGEVYLNCKCRIIYINSKPWVVFNSDGDASMLSSYSSCTQIPIWKCKKY